MRWFAKEVYLNKILKIQTISSGSLEKLRLSKRGSRFISNIINYDILSNQRYVDDFSYITMDQREEHKSSDFISKCLYIGEDLNLSNGNSSK